MERKMLSKILGWLNLVKGKRNGERKLFCKRLVLLNLLMKRRNGLIFLFWYIQCLGLLMNLKIFEYIIKFNYKYNYLI